MDNQQEKEREGLKIGTTGRGIAPANKDKEASQNARLENILGAIQNNLDQIPELRDRIRSIVKKWNS